MVVGFAYIVGQIISCSKGVSYCGSMVFLFGLLLSFYHLDCLQVITAHFGKFFGNDNGTIHKT